MGIARAFVTGAHGMVGAWLVRALLDRGVEVTALQRTPNARTALALEGLEERCTVVRGDLTEPGVVQRAIAEHECDTVFHLAAQTIVGTARESPVATFETNIRGTWLLMDACRVQGVERVVVAGSDRAYGAHDVLPYSEALPLDPQHPYDVSKAAADLITRSYFHTYGVAAAVARFPNIYGGGDLNPSRLVPELTAAVLAGRAPIIRSDGSPVREFLYAEDAAAAYLAMADALTDPERPAGGEAFNVGGDTPHSVREVVDLLIEVSGADVVADYQGAVVPAGQIDEQYVDSTKLRSWTGWAPKVSLREGLQRTVDWYRAHPSALAD